MINFLATFLHWILAQGLPPLAALVLWAFIVRAILFPIGLWTHRHAQETELLQPRRAAIKEQYADDQAKMQQELLKLYQEAGTGPFTAIGGTLLSVVVSIAGFLACNASKVKSYWSFHPFGSTLVATEKTIMHIPQGLILTAIVMLLSFGSTWINAKHKPPEAKQLQKLMAVFSAFLFLMFSYLIPFYLYWFIAWVTIFTIISNLLTNQLQRDK